jgi:hypothetical protein
VQWLCHKLANRINLLLILEKQEALRHSLKVIVRWGLFRFPCRGERMFGRTGRNGLKNIRQGGAGNSLHTAKGLSASS